MENNFSTNGDENQCNKFDNSFYAKLACLMGQDLEYEISSLMCF